MKTTLNTMISTHLQKLREGATTFVLWENSPKKKGAFPKREIDTDKLQKITGGQ
jgi:bacteriocin-like protein